MQKLNINLENCYGIKKFKTELDFSSHRSVAIYASNGMMKTSFAKTFEDLSKGVNSEDLVYSKRITLCEIKDENNKELTPKSIFVIRPNDKAITPESVSTLLASTDLRKEYVEAHKKIDDSKNNLLKKLKELSGISQNIEKKISEHFSNEDFLEIVKMIDIKISNGQVPKFQNIKYNEIFNDKVWIFLQIPDVQMQIKEYVEKYDELLNKSKYLKREFNHYNITSIKDKLKEHNFFKAKHSITLYDKSDKQEIRDEEGFEAIIQEEENIILTNPDLKNKWDNIHQLINKNIELRSFGDYLLSHRGIVPELEHPDIFAQEIWISYFIDSKELCHELLQEYQNGKFELEKINIKTKEHEKVWKKVIDIFNSRFIVPFQISIENKEDVILQNVMANIKYDYEDSSEVIPIESDMLLKVLSSGEKKALYILNILFEVEVRIIANQETLFVIDDIADSFDYKNKHAIIQYLKELSEEEKFKLIILTHNFDFFRTVQSRGIVSYKQCLFTYIIKGEVKLEQIDGFKNPFIGWLKELDVPKIFVAFIPFARNIIEYTKGVEHEDYKTLTLLVHWKNDTGNILVSHLIEILKATFPIACDLSKLNNTDKVIDMIFNESEKCLNATEGFNFENKIILSIGIRLKAEQYMFSKIHNKSFVPLDGSNQTYQLFKEYVKDNSSETEKIEILKEVFVMTPENIHLNSFMYEPILDMSDESLKVLYKKLNF